MTLFSTVPSLKVLSIIVFDVETKVLDTEIFSQHTITDLNSLHYISFAQSEEAFTVEGNKRIQKLNSVVEKAQLTVYSEIANMHYEEFNKMHLLQLNTYGPLHKMGKIGKSK